MGTIVQQLYFILLASDLLKKSFRNNWINLLCGPLNPANPSKQCVSVVSKFLIAYCLVLCLCSPHGICHVSLAFPSPCSFFLYQSCKHTYADFSAHLQPLATFAALRVCGCSWVLNAMQSLQDKLSDNRATVAINIFWSLCGIDFAYICHKIRAARYRPVNTSFVSPSIILCLEMGLPLNKGQVSVNKVVVTREFV